MFIPIGMSANGSNYLTIQSTTKSFFSGEEESFTLGNTTEVSGTVGKLNRVGKFVDLRYLSKSDDVGV